MPVELTLTTGSGYPLEMVVRRPDGTLWDLATADVQLYLRRLPTPADTAGLLLGPFPATITDPDEALVLYVAPPETFDAGGLWTLTPVVTVDEVPQFGIPKEFLVRTAP